MMIPSFDYRRSFDAHQEAFRAAFDRVIQSGQLILGPEVASFEREFAEAMGVEHAVGVASGTDALLLALRACGIGPGDEVITTANGPVPTVAAIRALHAIPRFVDIDRDTLLIDPQAIQRVVHRKTKAIVVVHLYGQVAPLEKIQSIASQLRLPLIEDCAQAHGATWNGKKAGTWGEVGCFSFYPTKNLGAFGDGGLCITRRSELAEKIRSMATYGFERGERIAYCDGTNSRLDELQAAFLRVRLPFLTVANQRRSEIAHRYQVALADHPLIPIATHADSQPVWHQFVVRSAQRSLWREELARAGIQTQIHYADAIHLMPAFRDLGYLEGELPNTETACREVFSLPVFPELTETEVDYVVEQLIRLEAVCR